MIIIVAETVEAKNVMSNNIMIKAISKIKVKIVQIVFLYAL